MFELLRRLARNDRGNFALSTAISLIPLMGLTGMGVDFSRAHSARTTIQNEADAIAIAVGSLGPKETQSGLAATMIREATERSQLGAATFQGTWLTDKQYQVRATANVPRTLSRLIPVGGETIAVSSVAVASYTFIAEVWNPPTMTNLDPDAWDLNRIYAYCFNEEVGKKNKAAGRSKRTAIADNDRQKKTKYTAALPQCELGETLSFELENIREANQFPDRLNRSSTPTYRYYTDTTNKKDPNTGKPTNTYVYDPSVGKLLETVLCDKKADCEAGSKTLPSGSFRTNQQNTKACTPGKYLYYGWEDRPGGDNDFNDIRIAIECPKIGPDKPATATVRLVR